MFGREVFLPVDVIFGKPPQEYPDTTEYIAKLQEGLESAHEYVHVKIQCASSRQKRYYDRKANGKSYNSGDLVWSHEPTRKLGRCPKLQRYWKGPFTVLQKTNDLLYRIQWSPKTKPKVVHFDRLKEYRYRGSLDGGKSHTTKDIADVNEQDSSIVRGKVTDASSDEDEGYMREPDEGLPEFEDISSGLSIGEGALQNTQGQTDVFCLEGSGQSPGTSYENVRSGHDSPETSVEKKTLESGQESLVSFIISGQGSTVTTKKIVSERGKDLQEGLGNGPLEINGCDAETLTRDNPRRSKRTRQVPDRLTYS